MNLHDFVRESNRIENIHHNPTQFELAAHKLFLDPVIGYEDMTVEHLQEFVALVQPRAELRDQYGMNVFLTGTSFIPPKGGPAIRSELEGLLTELQADISSASNPSPYVFHQRYETLHPFQDGNGRSGRALWAWHRKKLGRDSFELGFLHNWYYESLEHSQGR